jgi:hypothetical protein
MDILIGILGIIELLAIGAVSCFCVVLSEYLRESDKPILAYVLCLSA